jgi:hypothetical protein
LSALSRDICGGLVVSTAIDEDDDEGDDDEAADPAYPGIAAVALSIMLVTDARICTAPFSAADSLFVIALGCGAALSAPS